MNSSASVTYLQNSSAPVTYFQKGTTISVQGLDVVQGGILKTNGVQVGLQISTYSSGGIYTFTATTDTLKVGISSMTITLTSSGTYLLFGQFNLIYNAATFAASQVITYNLFRTNNTPGVISNSQSQVRTRIITAITDEAGKYETPTLLYTTVNTNDILTLRGSVSVIPSAGSLQANQSNLLAVRIY